MKQHPIEIPEVIPTFEREYRLPELDGSDRQIAYARIIRHKFLSRLLPTIIETTAHYDGFERNSIFSVTDEIRNELDAATWINNLKPHQNEPREYVLRRHLMNYNDDNISMEEMSAES